MTAATTPTMRALFDFLARVSLRVEREDASSLEGRADAGIVTLEPKGRRAS